MYAYPIGLNIVFLFSIIFKKNVKIAFFIHYLQIVEKYMVLRCVGKTPPVGVLAFWGGRITLPRRVKRPI